MRNMRVIKACIAAFCLSIQPAMADPEFPKLTGRVVDAANLIPDDVEKKLDTDLAAFEKKTGHQFVVATLNDLDGLDIADYGYQLGRFWGIGGKGVNDGVMLLLYPGNGTKGSGRTRIEVGYGMEHVITDADSSRITRDVLIPALKQPGSMSDKASNALVAGAAAIIEKATPDDEENAEFAAKRKEQEKRDAQIMWDNFINAVTFLFGLIAVSVILALGYLFFTRKKRAAKRQAAIEEARRQAVIREKEEAEARKRRLANLEAAEKLRKELAATNARYETSQYVAKTPGVGASFTDLRRPTSNPIGTPPRTGTVVHKRPTPTPTPTPSYSPPPPPPPPAPSPSYWNSNDDDNRRSSDSIWSSPSPSDSDSFSGGGGSFGGGGSTGEF